jgi:hypothetical protein
MYLTRVRAYRACAGALAWAWNFFSTLGRGPGRVNVSKVVKKMDPRTHGRTAI